MITKAIEKSSKRLIDSKQGSDITSYGSKKLIEDHSGSSHRDSLLYGGLSSELKS